MSASRLCSPRVACALVSITNLNFEWNKFLGCDLASDINDDPWDTQSQGTLLINRTCPNTFAFGSSVPSTSARGRMSP